MDTNYEIMIRRQNPLTDEQLEFVCNELYINGRVTIRHLTRAEFEHQFPGVQLEVINTNDKKGSMTPFNPQVEQE